MPRRMLSATVVAAILFVALGLNAGAAPSGPGRIVFISDRDGNWQIYVMNTDGSNVTRLTNLPGIKESPVFSPDGGRIAFVSYVEGSDQIFVMNMDGSNVIRLTNPPGENGEPTFSPDGRRIAFSSFASGLSGYQMSTHQIYVMNVDGSNVTRLTNDPQGTGSPSFSPTGQRIAFTGDNQIYLMDTSLPHKEPFAGIWPQVVDLEYLDYFPAGIGRNYLIKIKRRTVHLTK